MVAGSRRSAQHDKRLSPIASIETSCGFEFSRKSCQSCALKKIVVKRKDLGSEWHRHSCLCRIVLLEKGSTGRSAGATRVWVTSLSTNPYKSLAQIPARSPPCNMNHQLHQS